MQTTLSNSPFSSVAVVANAQRMTQASVSEVQGCTADILAQPLALGEGQTQATTTDGCLHARAKSPLDSPMVPAMYVGVSLALGLCTLWLDQSVLHLLRPMQPVGWQTTVAAKPVLTEDPVVRVSLSALAHNATVKASFNDIQPSAGLSAGQVISFREADAFMRQQAPRHHLQ